MPKFFFHSANVLSLSQSLFLSVSQSLSFSASLSLSRLHDTNAFVHYIYIVSGVRRCDVKENVDGKENNNIANDVRLLETRALAVVPTPEHS